MHTSQHAYNAARSRRLVQVSQSKDQHMHQHPTLPQSDHQGGNTIVSEGDDVQYWYLPLLGGSQKRLFDPQLPLVSHVAIDRIDRGVSHETFANFLELAGSFYASHHHTVRTLEVAEFCPWYSKSEAALQ